MPEGAELITPHKHRDHKARTLHWPNQPESMSLPCSERETSEPKVLPGRGLFWSLFLLCIFPFSLQQLRGFGRGGGGRH